jgi:hypothetical protein
MAKAGGMSALELVPITLDDANAFVRYYHRHHRPVPGAKFCLAVAAGSITKPGDPSGIVGVAIVGRPVAAGFDDGWTLEVNRSCVLPDVKMVNSMLYGAAWRAAKALGYRRLITYTLKSESGTSLRAAGWRIVAERKARSWATESGRPRVDKSPFQEKLLWEAV